MYVYTGNQCLFRGRQLRQSRRHRAKVKRVIGRKEVRVIGATFLILSTTPRRNAVIIDSHLEPRLAASGAVFHPVIVERGPELAQGSLIAICQSASVKVAPSQAGSCPWRTADSSSGIITGLRRRRCGLVDRASFRAFLGRAPVAGAGPRRPRRGCAGGRSGRRQTGLRTSESLSRPPFSHSSPGSESASNPNCPRYLRGRAGESSTLA